MGSIAFGTLSASEHFALPAHSILRNERGACAHLALRVNPTKGNATSAKSDLPEGLTDVVLDVWNLLIEGSEDEYSINKELKEVVNTF